MGAGTNRPTDAESPGAAATRASASTCAARRPAGPAPRSGAQRLPRLVVPNAAGSLRAGRRRGIARPRPVGGAGCVPGGRGPRSRGPPAGWWSGEEEEVHVAHALAVGSDVDALGPDDPLDRGHGGAEHRAQRGRLGRRELGDGFGVAAELDDQLAGIGPGAGVVGHLPPVVFDRRRRRGRRSGRPAPRRRCRSRATWSSLVLERLSR